MPLFRRRTRLLALVLLALGLSFAGSTSAAPARKPSIVLILTDDEDLASHRVMKKTKTLLEDQGVVFTNYFVSYSFCCPSRATIMRGQYPHNHRIEGNEWPTGGYEKFRAMGTESSTIATWLDGAGYHTAFFGKLMNGYEPEKHEPLPGWDEWYGVGGKFANFNYTLNENGRIKAYGQKPEDHLTDVLARKAAATIRKAGPDEPLFLYIAPYDPHSPATPAPRYAKAYEDEPLPRPPSFDEADVSDKPSYVRDLPPLEPWQKEALTAHHRDRLRALRAVDDMVETVVEALRDVGRLDDTYVVYSSDNGFHMGQHRLFVGKTSAYEEDIHVPLIVRGPGVPKGVRIGQMVLNNDLAPTFAEIGGATAPGFVDGRSFLPLLAGRDVPWRKSFLLERREMETHEISGKAVFDAIRTERYTYIEYGTGERELYDLAHDPWQLDNRAETADPALLQALATRLAELRNCAATNCRELEDRSVEPTTMPVAASEGATKG
ncbi:sulfatase [Benzoatithermus flavus]|uniref:Sulfatase n=1 Tax=Benzoatithermus flavus TaxID=3108223 RepID=A0ABU8XL43_9PROT